VTPLAAWLEEVEARAAKASEPPWHATGSLWDDGKPECYEGTQIYLVSLGKSAGMARDSSKMLKPDADFIAHARADVPALVALLRLAVSVRDEALKMAIRGQQALDFANKSFGVKPGEEKPYYAPELAAAIADFDAAVAARGKED